MHTKVFTVLVAIAFYTLLAILGSLIGLFFGAGMLLGGVATIVFTLAIGALWIFYLDVFL